MSLKCFSWLVWQQVALWVAFCRTNLAGNDYCSFPLFFKRFSVSALQIFFSCPFVDFKWRFFFRFGSIFCRLFWIIFNTSSTFGSRFGVGHLCGTHFGNWICRRQMANDSRNVQPFSAPRLVHNHIRNCIFDAGLPIFATVHRFAGTFSLSFVVSFD